MLPSRLVWLVGMVGPGLARLHGLNGGNRVRSRRNRVVSSRSLLLSLVLAVALALAARPAPTLADTIDRQAYPYRLTNAMPKGSPPVDLVALKITPPGSVQDGVIDNK